MASFSSRAVVVAVVALAACGGGGGSSGVDIRTFFPADGEVSGWTQDSTLAVVPGSRAGDPSDSVLNSSVDGDADVFQEAGLAQLGVQAYRKGNDEVMSLRVWQMDSATAAQQAFDGLPGHGRYQQTWTACSGNIGDACRIANADNLQGNDYWWVTTRKKTYIVEAIVTPNSETADDDAMVFLQAALAKIP